eukprot:6142050-Ditylum_brightwellii.AAC.1
MDDYETNKEEYNIYPYPPTWDNVYDMDIQITTPMNTMGSDFIVVNPEKPVECWNTVECRQYSKYYALPVGKTALEVRKNAAVAYHDSSVLKVPPEER